MDCSPQAYAVITWSPISAVLLGGSGSFRIWDLVEGNRSLGMDHWEYTLSGYFLSCSLLPINHVNRGPPPYLLCCDGPNPLKAWAKRNPSSFNNLLLLGIW